MPGSALLLREFTWRAAMYRKALERSAGVTLSCAKFAPVRGYRAEAFHAGADYMASIRKRGAQTMPKSGSLWLTATVFGLVAMVLSACVSSHVMIGKARPPVSPDQVQIYLHPPLKYDEIAVLDTSSRASFAVTAQGKTDKVIQRLKDEAAKLGANGILLQGIGDQAAGSVGTGFGSASASGNSAVGVGVGSSATLYQKAGSGIAIFVYPDPKAQQ